MEVEKKYYANGEDAYSMKWELTDLITQRDFEREQRAALNNARRAKQGKANENMPDEVIELGNKITVLDVE